MRLTSFPGVEDYTEIEERLRKTQRELAIWTQDAHRLAQRLDEALAVQVKLYQELDLRRQESAFGYLRNLDKYVTIGMGAKNARKS